MDVQHLLYNKVVKSTVVTTGNFILSLLSLKYPLCVLLSGISVRSVLTCFTFSFLFIFLYAAF